MARCEIARGETGRGLPELRAAPPGEPLAGCAFVWPDGWAARGFDWAPPPLFVPARLLRLTGEGDGVLDVRVARFGVEVDGLAFLEQWVGGRLEGRGWSGLPVARGAVGPVEWRVVHAGPAVFLLSASGAARRHVDRAARTFRHLAGRGPEAEPVRATTAGPLRCLRLAAWQPERDEAVPHGHDRLHLRLATPRDEVAAYLRLHVVDRRVHVGVDPRALLAAADAAEAEAGLVAGEPAPDPGPGGPASLRIGRRGDVPVEIRRALRQIGPGLAVITGVWPAPAHAPVAWLNGRRHFDLVLATLRPARPPA